MGGRRRTVSRVLRGADRKRAHARGVRPGGRAVSGVVRRARPRPAGHCAAPCRRVHPHASWRRTDREAAPRGDPDARRLARRVADPAAQSRDRGAWPKHVVTTGATQVLSAEETRTLLNAIDVRTIVRLRDRALIGVMVYSFARVSAVLGMR